MMTIYIIGIVLCVAATAACAAALVVWRLDIAAGRRGKSVYSRWLANRYREKFELQLVDALATMSNAMRAGFSINQAFESVVEMGIHPISDEFALLLQQMRVGMSFDDALAAFDARMASEDLTLVVTAIDISRKTGGNLTEVFDVIASTIRGRMRIQRRVKTLTAQGRLQGIIVTCMPLVLGVAMTILKPDLMMPFLTSWIGLGCLLVVAVLMVAGWLLIRKIIAIKV